MELMAAVRASPKYAVARGEAWAGFGNRPLPYVGFGKNGVDALNSLAWVLRKAEMDAADPKPLLN